ncbi:MAG: transglycosylase SLT domain-containing protein [Alphaproteobacteria bacterium]
MDNASNTIQSKMLGGLLASAPHGVANAIKTASARTGVNFAYLVQQAKVESSFNPGIKAKTSSASGLYQFIESTWLSMVKKHGDKYGMGDLADKIGDNGRVANKALKQQILSLRNDPEKASAMAAEFARENEKSLNEDWGGKIGATELYFAHFMGARQAAAFLKARDENPMQQAALIFPAAAKANRTVFYDTKTGRPKTMDEVYAFFDKKFEIHDLKIETPTQDMPQVAERIASSVFIGGVNPNYNSGYANNTARNYNPAYNSLAAQSLVSNPLEILLLAQLDVPGAEKAKSGFRLND